jgi:hypothetical protein
MVTIKTTIIHDEHTRNTITLKNTLLNINKGDLIDIKTDYGAKIKGTVIRITHTIIVSGDDDVMHSHYIHIHVY